MKILYGITKSNFGGAQRYVFDLAEEMKRSGHNVVVLCGGQGALIDKLRESKIRIIPLAQMERDISVVKEISSFFEIIKILRKETPDVFHLNSSKIGGVGALAGRLVGIRKVIFTAHGWAFNEPRPWWQRLVIKFFAWATILFTHQTICVSNKTKNDVESWPFITNKLTVIHNGIRDFTPSPRESDNFTVGAISELHRIKGLDVLLRAWSKFIKKHQAKLVIVGDGEEKQNLINMAKNIGISGSVSFRGFIDNARSMLSNFDIFCMPSRSEGLPYSLLEAGSAGLAVIATSVGGIPEIIENGTNGILIPTEDSEVLFSSLMLLAGDGDLRKRLGTNLKSSIQADFSFSQMAKETLNLYL